MHELLPMLQAREGKQALHWSHIFILPLQCFVLQGLTAVVIQARKGSFLQTLPSHPKLALG